VLADDVSPRPLGAAEPTGVLFCQNVRFTKNSTAGWQHVRAIRVLSSTGLKMRSSHAYIVHAGSEVTELGTVPIAADGSFAVEVPADQAIAFQAVDAEGRSELNEMSWIFVRPGETRSCAGCHQPRQAAPLAGDALGRAVRVRPLRLVGQGRPLHFRGNNAAVTGLMEMQMDRFREVAGVNRHGDTTEPLATGPQEVESLVADLRGSNDDLKISAAQRLAVFRSPAAAAALAECLGSGPLSHRERVRVRVPGATGILPVPGAHGTGETPVAPAAGENLSQGNPPSPPAPLPKGEGRLSNPPSPPAPLPKGEGRLVAYASPISRPCSREARVAAAVALAACGTRDSVEPLLAALTDRDPLAAQAAAIALENLTGHVEPFDAFAPIEQREQQIRKWQAWFHGTTWDAIEQELIARLANPDRDVVRRAAVTLGHVGSKAGLPALRDYLVRHRDENPYPEWMKQGHQGDGARFNAEASVNPRTLQAVTRAIGCLKDAESVPMLAETIAHNSDPAGSNLFLAEACVEALGRIATPDAEAALIQSHAGLKDYYFYVGWYGDHSALYACHASPVHYLIAESLDAMGSRRAGPILPNMIRSVPTDPDRALLPVSDDCETLVGRVARRSGAEATVVETCLAMLGDPQATANKDIRLAISTTYHAWGGKPDPENRAAHILSAVCRDRKYEPRVRAALDRYRARPADKLVRAFAGGGLPSVLPVKNWVCFFLARTLGNLGDPQSVDSLMAVLEQVPSEGVGGRPDPSDASVLFLHNELTPCYRAAAAWALGRIGDRRATPLLLKAVAEPLNAPDTRYAAAEALERLVEPANLAQLKALAEACPEISTKKALERAVEKLGP
jgi:HEAT repeat protein